MKFKMTTVLCSAILLTSCASVKTTHYSDHDQVADADIATQRQALAQNTQDKGFGPQAPRDIESKNGNNEINFSLAPESAQMNLCNIHFHKNAEHKGGEFSEFAGNGNGEGYQSGYTYTGNLSETEVSALDKQICPSSHSQLYPGDTIEVHYVYSSAQVNPGPTLNSCLSESINNPELRVESQVFVVVNDNNALDFGELTQYGIKNDVYQALSIPDNTGTPVLYTGSTTGPGYNETGSPFQVTWNVRPNVAKVDIETVGDWCEGNVFNEDHAHGVRNLVTNPDLLSNIE